MPSEGYSYSTLRSRLRSLKKYGDASEKRSNIEAKSVAKNTYNAHQSSTKQKSPTSGPDTRGNSYEYRSPTNSRASRSYRNERSSERDVRSSHSPPPTSLDKSGNQNDSGLYRERQQNQNAKASKNIQGNGNQSKSNPYSSMRSMSTRTVDNTSTSKRLQYLQSLRSMKSKSRLDPIHTIEQKRGANRNHIEKSHEKESEVVQSDQVHVNNNTQQNRQSIFKTNSIRKDEVHVNKTRSVSFADDIQHEKEENESHSRQEHKKIDERSRDLDNLKDVEHSLSHALEKNWGEKSDVKEIAKALALAHTARRELEKGNTYISKKELKRTLRKSESSILTKLQTMRSSKSTIRAASLPDVQKNGVPDRDSMRYMDHEVEIEAKSQEKSNIDESDAFPPSLSINKDMGNDKCNEAHAVLQKQKAKEIVSKRMQKKSGDSNNFTSSSISYDPKLNTQDILEPATLDEPSPHDSTMGKVELQNVYQRNDGYFGQRKMQLQPFQSNDGTIVYMDPISGQFFQPAPNKLLNDAMINHQCTPVVNTFPHQKSPHYEERSPRHNDSKPVQSSLNERLPTDINSEHTQSSFNSVRGKESLSKNNSVSRSFSPQNIDEKSTRSSIGSTKSSQLIEKQNSVENKSISRSFSSSRNMKKASSTDDFELNREESLIKKKTSSRSFSPPNIDKESKSAGSHQSVIRNRTASRSFSPPNVDDKPKTSSLDSTERLKLNGQGCSMENNNTSYPPSQNNTSIPVDTQEMNRRDELTLKKKAVSWSFSPPHIDNKHTESSASHIQKCKEDEHSGETDHVPLSKEVKIEWEEISHDQTNVCSNDKSFAEFESSSPSRSRSNYSSNANSSKEPTNIVLSSSVAQESMHTKSEEDYCSTHEESKPRKDQTKVYQTKIDREKERPKDNDNDSSKQKRHVKESERSPSRDAVKKNAFQDGSLLQECTYEKVETKVMSLEDYKKNRSRKNRESAPSTKTRKRRNSLNKRSKGRDRSMSRESEQQSLDQSTFSAIVSSSHSSDYSSSRMDSGSTYSSEYSSSSSYSDSSRSYDSYDSEYSSDY
ncbi:predicted protein [Chaetoceros tenuissimus]|uniref:Uncharacterized protein n=1 Tax=Chaetoceros tenuissimus TaxID=426638 RepID=A0AAD3H5W3_9STRA|nr:predicted protein [Chaetoceros tenuissimus]